MKQQSKYYEMPSQTLSRKVGSSLIDGLLLLIVGVILTFTLGFSGLRNNQHFKENNDLCFQSIHEMYKIQDEAKLQILNEDGESVLATADYFEVYITKQIYRSYLHFKEDFLSANISLSFDEALTRLENDELAYYFIQFKLEKNIQVEDYENQSPLDYFKTKIFFQNFSRDDYLSEVGNLPILKSSVAIPLYQQLTKAEKHQDLFYAYSDAVLAIRNIGLKDLLHYNVYQNYYVQYEKAYQMMARYENRMLLLTYTFSFLLCIALPFLISKDGWTIGRILTRTRYIGMQNEKPSFGKKGGILILSWLCNLGILILISLFTLGFQNLSLPYLTIQSIHFSFLQLLLISMAFFIINTLMMCIRKDHRSLIDLLWKVKQVDITCYVEPKKETSL